jgi:hypothetical protein
MGYAQYLATHELFWALLAGGFLGGAIAALTRRTGRSNRPGRARARNRSLSIAALALAVAAATGGLLFPPELAIVGLPALSVAGASLLVVGASLRFPRSAGMPVLLLAGAGAVFLAVSVSGWRPVREPQSVAQVVVVSMAADSLTLEVTEVLGAGDQAAQPRIVRQEGGELVATVEEIVLSPYLFLLGGRRFVWFSGPSEPSEADGAAPPVMLPSGLYARRTVEARVSTVNLLQRYTVAVSPNPGSLRLVRER